MIGAFNSGGTSTKSGLIIGVEMMWDLSGIPGVVAHELIHFNQKYPFAKPTLLEQSLMEGAADFIGELISGRQINGAALQYFEAHENELCGEFASIMNDAIFHGWLYGSAGKKEGRPNDLGYAMGYKICKAYYEKQEDKKGAVAHILNLTDAQEFLKSSGYLMSFM